MKLIELWQTQDGDQRAIVHHWWKDREYVYSRGWNQWYSIEGGKCGLHFENTLNALIHVHTLRKKTQTAAIIFEKLGGQNK